MAPCSFTLRHACAAPAFLLLCGGGFLSNMKEARADTSANFDVAAVIVPGCLVDGFGSSGNVGSIGQLDFGTDSSLSTAGHVAMTSSAQLIRLRCTPGVNMTMSIDGGAHSASGIRNLQLGTSPTARIGYRVCRDAACNQPIAIGGTTTDTISSTNSNDVRLPIYAALTLPGSLRPGTYTDTLTVTITW